MFLNHCLYFCTFLTVIHEDYIIIIINLVTFKFKFQNLYRTDKINKVEKENDTKYGLMNKVKRRKNETMSF